MNTMTTIAERRSIRKFDAKPEPRETVEQILQAGINAPSAKNRQPWRFVVVTGDGDKTAMLQVMRSGLEWMDQRYSNYWRKASQDQFSKRIIREKK